MRMLVADKLDLGPLEELEVVGVKLVYRPELTAADLPAALRELGDVAILVVRSMRVDKPALDAAPGLSLVVRAGAGVNTIDVDTCSKRGVYVANCPGKNAEAVAELAMT